MSVELGLAALATADLAIKAGGVQQCRYGEKLIDLYSSFSNASGELHERVLLIEVNWTRTLHQIEFLKRIWQSLDSDHRNQQDQILQVLATKLTAATHQLERVHKKRDDKHQAEVKRWKYAFVKENIDQAINDLDAWQKIFDPSWFLMLKMASPLIDQELAKTLSIDSSSGNAPLTTAKSVRDSLRATTQTQTIFLPKEGLVGARREAIPYCSAELMLRPSKRNTFFVIDSVPCVPEVNEQIFKRDIRDLARKLSASDPVTFGLLQCRGVVKNTDKTINASGSGLPALASFDFVFIVPPNFQDPRSLRQHLVTSNQSLSLSSRFQVAQQLAQSVSYVHTYGFVHKSIRPETILVFDDSRCILSYTALLGFEKFRPAAGGLTLRAGDCVWEKNLYRHPRRQGLTPEEYYSMQHDIYSLGVCLLEIGLWQSLVVYGEGKPSPSSLLPVLAETDDGVAKASLLKDSLVDMAKQKLPCRMGDKYAGVVVNCLTCLDATNFDFGDKNEFENVDGILINVRYIEKIILQLRSISI
ncbi:hypothetical protein BDV95DRAFT_656486 [Massariosphaeria phaeospora]|uniref:Protein kinase domain-containing protein n=1 Tax=Massariosphaeria phaeospora TaxID=100035 RepID=A0A7C8IAV7_9PLEO|nr:hypothetical protein BDV95DRAFT_656486 [Massariosphaeria phaeospora]